VNDRKALKDARINVLPAGEVGVWHCMLELALELDKPGMPLHSTRLGAFEYVTADGRTGRFTPELMAQVFELPRTLVESAIAKLIELKIVAYDGETLVIEDAADWFVPLAQSPQLRN
jgi:hypothetical protein